MEELGKNYESVAKFKRVYRFREFQLLEDGPILLASGQRVRATPKALQVLWTLVEANAQLVSKEELASAVWGTGKTDDNNIARHVAMLRAAIGEGLIETVPRLGYRFCGAATCETWPSTNAEGPLLTELTRKADQESRASSSGEQRNRSLAGVAFRTLALSRPASLCWIYAIYAALYSIALLLEISYEFQSFATTTLPAAVVVFAVSLLGGFFLAQRHHLRVVVQGRNDSLGMLIVSHVALALLVTFATFAILPNRPVTLMATRAQTAQAAYLKSVVLYFLPMIVLVWLIPYHFVCALGREAAAGRLPQVQGLLRGRVGTVSPVGSVFLRPDRLSIGLLSIGVFSVVATQDLLARLSPSPNMNLFMILALLRSLGSFAFCVSCLAWYRRNLDNLTLSDDELRQLPLGVPEDASRREPQFLSDLP